MGSIYEPGPTERAEWCNPVNSDDFEPLIAESTGASRKSIWKPAQVKMIRKTLRQRFTYSDCPWRSSTSLFFRPSAIEKMKPIFDACGELLPLECPDAELWVFNPTIVLDALDEKASKISRFSSGRIMSIDKYVFHADIVAGVDMFKLANLRASPTVVNDRFVDLWNASGLKGLEFKKLWSSD